MAKGESFDYIVVGAGSAGCVLAARLSEDADKRVLLLEAGGKAWMPLYHVPLMAGVLFRVKYNNWAYSTEPEPHLDNRRIFWPRGKVLGGSHRINGTVYARGHRLDYDTWRQMGNTGWGFDDILPYFKKSEDFQGPDWEHHGKTGPLTVSLAPGRDPLYDALIESGRAAGFPVADDLNAPEREGFGRHWFTTKNGRRWTTAQAFLDPALSRPNLELRLRAMTLRVLLEGNRAVGIEYARSGKTEIARAERAVILAGGAINSPMVLMHSGIGPAAQLRDVGLEVAYDLPGVGENLHDHPVVRMQFAGKDGCGMYKDLRWDRAMRHVAQTLLFGTGVGNAFPLQAGGYVKTRPELAAPDIQCHFFPVMWSKLHGPGLKKTPVDRPGMISGFNIAVPESRGWLKLRSANPLDKPRLLANYLATEGDKRTMRDGVKLVRRVMREKPIADFVERDFAPGPDVQSDAEIDAWVRQATDTIFHPVGTCKMGIDPMAVVDPRLKVHGIEGLRVADASVMPVISASNTNAPTIMIAEKAADMIKEDYR
jgi:choline dehydrogenase